MSPCCLQPAATRAPGRRIGRTVVPRKTCISGQTPALPPAGSGHSRQCPSHRASCPPPSQEAHLDNPLGPWFPDLPPLASHPGLYHTQLSPGTAPPGNLTKFPFVLSLFHPLGPQSRLLQPASPTPTFTAHLLALPLHGLSPY